MESLGDIEKGREFFSSLQINNFEFDESKSKYVRQILLPVTHKQHNGTDFFDHLTQTPIAMCGQVKRRSGRRSGSGSNFSYNFSQVFLCPLFTFLLVHINSIEKFDCYTL